MPLLRMIVCACVLMSALSLNTPSLSAETLDEWRKQVISKITENRTYPRSALSREIEGRAMVLVMVNADGTITGHNVLQATGQAVLDREIPKIVKRSSPLPALPSGEQNQNLVVPITWSLN